MLKTQNRKNYIIPLLCALLLIVVLGIGIVYIRSYMVKQTVEERSSQLEEMVVQIQANLETGLENHWNLLAGVENVMEGQQFADENQLIDSISTLENQYCTDLYDCRLMFLDTLGETYLD